MKSVKIQKTDSPSSVVKVRFCDTFLTRLKGLMFSKELAVDGGIVIKEAGESRINTAIHMMFMNYDITVLWLDKNLVVVDKVLAKKWVLFYMPKAPAQYVVELHRSKFTEYEIGDQLLFLDKA